MVRAQGTLGFAAVLAACCAGAFNVNWWLACAAAAVLVLISLSQHSPYYSRYATQGNIGAQSLLLLGSTLNAVTAALVSFGLGRAIGWLWGI